MKELALDIDAPANWPLTLHNIKLDLRIEHDALDDIIMDQYLPDAIEWAERYMRRTIVARTHRWIISEFPDDVIFLPRGKVQSVTSVAYSNGGAVTTLTGPTSGSPVGTDYQEDLRGHRGRIMPNRGSSWPSTDVDVPAPVVITFVAGWNAVADVPAEIKRGLIARINDSLEVPSMPANGQDIEFPEKLLSGWRILA